MCRPTRTPTCPSTALRDAHHQAAVALLRRAGEQARRVREFRSQFQDETAADAARNRAMVHADANAGAWRFGQAWRPEDRAEEWDQERRQRSRETLARNVGARRRPGNV